MQTPEEQPSPSRIYLDIPPEFTRRLRAPLAEIVRGQGYALPEGIRFSEGPMPAAADGSLTKGWSPIIEGPDGGSPGRGKSAALVILAIAAFLGPQIRVEIHWIEGPSATSSQPRQSATPALDVPARPSPEQRRELDLRLEIGSHVARFR